MRKIFYFLVPSLFITTISFAPISSRTITGNIIDEKGEPIVAASVMETGTNNGTKADSIGNFSLTVSDNCKTLTISAVSFVSQTINIEKSNNFYLTLKSDEKALSEVVVTATRLKRQKKELGYSMATVSNSSLWGSYAPANNYTLNGKVAGLTVSNISRENTGKPRIVLRGMSSLRENKPTRRERKNIRQLFDSTGNDFNTEGYDRLIENQFLQTNGNPLSTFSIDVDAAAYSNVRRFINNGQMPPNGAIRTEEMINYFHYDYPQPQGEQPFSINTEVSICPWNITHKLLMIGLQGKKVPTYNLPPSNLVFLIDVSGSMQDPMKLPLVQSSMKLLADQLRAEDRVAIVTYAGNAGLELPPTVGSEKEKIKAAIDNLNAGGSTAGGEGIKLAYKIARDNFMQQQNNRVILCTDGDFNVGLSSDDELERLIEQERESGIFLTVLGYGMGNYQDAKMQKLADKGNGNHAYIDGVNEAKKVLVKEFGGTLFTIAKDVKLQLEFNPAKVQAYRLIGYENRILAKEDFNDDKKDAGELGSGHTVTALYEIIPVGVQSPFLSKNDELKYRENQTIISSAATGNELATVKFRYKEPDKTKSELVVRAVNDNTKQISEATENLRFAASVAQFAMLLRKSEFKGNTDYEKVITIAKTAIGKDEEGYRAEFVKLVDKAKTLDKSKETAKLEKKEDE